MKTLYVSNLDGTLMRNDITLSANTVGTVNALIEQGLSFTYATARSIKSARTITGGLHLTLPVITLNGLPMFQAADKAYAVANAMEELKSAATAVIGSSEEDSVARFLKQRFPGSEMKLN